MLLFSEVKTIPNEKKFSSSFPAHPAGSFHYPNLPRLPVLAKYSVVKVIIIIVIIIGRQGKVLNTGNQVDHYWLSSAAEFS